MIYSMEQKRIKEIAEYYRQAEHTPFHPSYRAFVISTKYQWYELVDEHWQFSFVAAMTPSGETYRDSDEMFQDIARKKLRIDTHGQNFAEGHPLAEYLLVPYKGVEVKINEAFRGIHDVLGHGDTRCPFETFEGEMEAIANHRTYYPKECWPALYGETLGQLCHYFAGYGFVEQQKAIVLPEEFWQ